MVINIHSKNRRAKLFNSVLGNQLTHENCASNAVINPPEFCPLLAIPKTIRHQLGSSIKRVVLIANNPAISIHLIHRVIKGQDLLVFFNNTQHLPLFAKLPNPHLYFFRSIFNNGLHWGLPPHPNNIPALEKLARNQQLAVAYSSYPPNIKEFPQNLKAVFVNPDRTSLILEKNPAWFDYVYKKEIAYSAPSSGFMLYRLFLQIRQTACLMENSFQIVLLGYNDSAGSTFWEGHNWEFERIEIQNSPRYVKIIPA